MTTPRPLSPPALAAGPRRHLDVRHAVAVCVGMVIGAGIFKTSPMVAGALASDLELYLAWAIGGVLSFIGALCFAEMAAAFPDAGGDYTFLQQAYGQHVGFLFAWSRFAVIHSGSMALLAFVFGDYASHALVSGALLPVAIPAALAPFVSPVLAAGLIVLLAILNLAGVRVGIATQVMLMGIVLSGLALLGAAGASLAFAGQAPLTPPGAPPSGTGREDWGTAIVFVFLAYGGWSDAATLSAEMRDDRHGIVRALALGLLLVAGLYLLANWAYLRGLGLEGLARSDAPAADLMRRAFGAPGELFIVAIVTLAAVSVTNALLIAGSRTTYAAARDLGVPTRLGHWHDVRGTPVAAVIALAVVSLGLVALGTATRGGFSTMVDYLSPVYWLFLTLSGMAVIVLRRRFPGRPRPFRVPCYPLLPLLFVACSAYVLYASLQYVKTGALAGVGVLAAGALLLPFSRRRRGAA